MVLRLLIAAIVVPALVAGAIAASARLLPPASRLRRIIDLPALAIAYVAAHLVTAGTPSFPPVDTTQGLLYLALIVAAIGLVGFDRDGWGVRVSRAVAVVAMLGLSLHPLVRYQWSLQASAAAVLGLGAASFALWAAYDALAARLSAHAVRAAWVIVFGGTALLLVLGRTALLGQLGGTIGVALAALALVTPREADADHGRSGLAFLAPMLHALLLNGFFYADVGAPASIALALSPLAAALALALAVNRTRMRIVVAALGVAVVLAPFCAREAAAYGEEDEYHYDYYQE
jgi:hypothetical protein